MGYPKLLDITKSSSKDDIATNIYHTKSMCKRDTLW